MKKVLPILGILILLGGVVAGLGIVGIIKIPGLTPVKKGKQVASKGAGPKPAPASTPAPGAAAKKPDKPTDNKGNTPSGSGQDKVVKKAPVIDPVKGAASVADLWNNMEPAKVTAILADWKDDDVARVFLQMDADKVAGILSVLPPKRASKISAIVEKQASEVKSDS